MELTGRKILVYHVANGECAPQTDQSSRYSHGTVCSSILSEFLPTQIEMMGISCADGDESIRIENMCTALMWCLKHPPDCLCMSVGTCNWLEAERIGELTRKLAEKGTRIFAAYANSGHVTFPAVYPWVTGVRYSTDASGMFREEKSPAGHNIVVGNLTCAVLERLSQKNSFFLTRTNSMAVPYALGQLLATDRQVADLPLWKRANSLAQSPEFAIPIVALTGPLDRMKELLALLQKNSYQALLFTDRQETDWSSMVLRVPAVDFAAWLKPLEKAGILLLDVTGELSAVSQCADHSADLNPLNAQAVFEDILRFFGAEEEGNQ